MGFVSQVRLAVCCIVLSASLFASKITGKVTNGSTNKPSAGDDVVLLSLSGGMQETARTSTDGKGEFSLDVSDEGVQHLIRVAHQRVNYFQPVPQGTTIADVTVYDAAKKVESLIGEGRVFRVLAADGQQLQISEMYILRNESQPPRTWMNDRTFEIVLPEGATLQEGMAAGPGGMPVTSSPVPTGEKNHYAFIFPIRPGRSQLQVTYRLSYSGSHDFSFVPDLPLAEFGVMLPKTMHLTPTGESFSPATDESGMTVFVAKSISPGQNLRFSLSGEGSAPREAQGSNMAGGETNSAAPGGGIGTPIGTPDPLSNTRWYLLGALVVVLVGGAVWTIRRKPASPVEARTQVPDSSSSSSSSSLAPVAPPSVSRASSSALILDALKEELFQLESDRVKGKISDQEYEAAKSGVNALLRRHMKKSD